MPTLLLTTVTGCVWVEHTHTATLPVGSAEDLFADVERGGFVFAGDAGTDVFELGVRTWARGSSRAAATRKTGRSRWGAQLLEHPDRGDHVQAGLLDAWGRSPDRHSGIDFAVVGPPRMDVELVLLDGWAELHGVTGEHLVTATGVVGTDVSGSMDLYASDGPLQLEARPRDGDVLSLEAVDGDLVLSLPRGLDYDLEVFADPGWGVTVTDLGFDSLSVDPGHVRAFSGTGAVFVTAIVTGGEFVLYEAPPEPATLEGGR